MSQKYIFPTQLFIVLEKLPIITWTHTTPNFYLSILNATWLYALTMCLKRDSSFHDSFLVESSAISINSNTGFFFENINVIKSTYILNYYLFHLYNVKTKLLLLVSNTKNNSEFYSIDTLFLNACWLEREASEMYGIFFYNKKDTRKLLLDYSRNEYPLKKDFSSEGYVDCFYSIFENDVIYLNNEIVEL